MGVSSSKPHPIETKWFPEFETGLPSLGVREGMEGKKYEPAIPGMILSIEDENRFERLYASNAPHTTAKEVRSCASCHRDPSALGYGKGKLNYTIKGNAGKWSFAFFDFFLA